MIEIIEAPFDAPQSLDAVGHYIAELGSRFGAGPSLGDDLLADREDLSPPRGVFLLALDDGEVVGCGGLRGLDNHTGEVKQLWVSEAIRRRGLGRQILEALEAHARYRSYDRLVLDTSGHLREAITLYERAGYIEIPAYNTNPYAEHWFEKLLVEAPPEQGDPSSS